MSDLNLQLELQTPTLSMLPAHICLLTHTYMVQRLEGAGLCSSGRSPEEPAPHLGPSVSSGNALVLDAAAVYVCVRVRSWKR